MASARLRSRGPKVQGLPLACKYRNRMNAIATLRNVTRASTLAPESRALRESTAVAENELAYSRMMSGDSDRSGTNLSQAINASPEHRVFAGRLQPPSGGRMTSTRTALARMVVSSNGTSRNRYLANRLRSRGGEFGRHH